MTYIKHGLSNHPLYRIWQDMKYRISNKNNESYNSYGGKGIRVCDEWVNNPEIFIRWALKNGYKKGLLIDRKDNDGNYEPNNCRFVTPLKSILNRRLLRKNNTSGYCGVSYNGEIKKWSSYITTNRTKKHLGSFNSARMAALRYDAEVFLLNDGRPVNFT